MKTYITPKYQLVTKRIILFVDLPILILVVVSALVSPQPSPNNGKIWISLIMFFWLVVLFYTSM